MVAAVALAAADHPWLGIALLAAVAANGGVLRLLGTSTAAAHAMHAGH